MLLVVIGLLIGTIGTLIGAGGGFILVPILLFLYPDMPPEHVTALSMFVVALNASSGTIAYLIHRRVHLRAALVFILASLPGAVLGIAFERYVERAQFEKIFGAAMIAYAAILLLRKPAKSSGNQIDARTRLSRRKYVLGGLVSFFVGFIASFLGIGGGIIHVPLLASVLNFPVHLATGTSHFILAATSWVATLEHIRAGHITFRDPKALELGIGALVGAQIGAVLSQRVQGKSILKFLAAALGLVGMRLILRQYF